VTLGDIWVQGEISNLSAPSSGHIYFTLKDPYASLRCVMWKGDARRMNISLQDGMEIEMHGHIGVYEPQGAYQFYADIIRPVGEGELYQEFQRLKTQLEAEGLFDPERKQPLPEIPRQIGIVTSGTGAALRDMINTLRRRFPMVDVVLAASPVQGTEAPPALVDALDSLNKLRPDVILLARGGGSIEDLWAFNDERVVRAVAESHVPVISGVGHETDFTLCDFAADLRAPTPTAAAELATPVTILELHAALNSYETRLAEITLSNLDTRHDVLVTLQERLGFYSPLRRIQTERQQVDELSRRAHAAWSHRISLEASHLGGQERRLEALNPLAVLGRGYAVVTRKTDGIVINKTEQAKPEQLISIRVSDGQFDAKVTDNNS
jgi:exodeoxyribonuclease VII large subunit